MDVLLHDNDHIALVSSWKRRLSPGMQDSSGSVCTTPSSLDDDVSSKETKLTIDDMMTNDIKKHRLLLVEDVPINREFIKLWLQSSFPHRLDIVEASNGQEALVYFQEAVESENPFDVVLLDIFMPIMNGFECLEEMVKRYGDQRPPIIAITTSAPNERNMSNCVAKFDDWWDKCDQNAMVTGMAKVINHEL